MRGSQSPPLEVTSAYCERLEGERLSIRLAGIWHDASAATHRPMLIVDGEDGRQRFPAVPRPRQAVGASVPRFDARFTVPASIESALDGHMTLLVGEAVIAVPPLQSMPEAEPAGESTAPASDDPALLGPLREELAQRARTEARLRAELAALQARVEDRGPASERLEAVRRELADELVRVRQAVEAHEQRRAEVESRAMVLAAELSELQHQREEMEGELAARRQECEGLKTQVSELESEVSTVKHEAQALRAAEVSSRAGREAAVAEVEALQAELERFAGAAARNGAGDPELQRAEALLAEARALTDSLD